MIVLVLFQMGNYKEIDNYREQAEQLEPVFAGLLHDGAITYRDAIALIFYLVDKKVLLIHWKPKWNLQKIESFEILQDTYPLDYVQAVINLLKKYSTNNTISIEIVGNLIQNEVIQRCIQSNSLLVRESHIKSGKVTVYETPERGKVNPVLGENGIINSHRKLITYYQFLHTMKSLQKLYLGGMLLLCAIYFKQLTSFYNQKITLANLSEFSLAIAPFVITPLFLIAMYASRKPVKQPSISFTFRNQDISKISGKYTYLYEYLKLQPIDNNNLNNVFLPYSIAFGFNTFWNNQFVKELPEPAYSETPLDY